MVRPTNSRYGKQSTEPALVLSVTGELDMNTVEVLAGTSSSAWPTALGR